MAIQYSELHRPDGKIRGWASAIRSMIKNDQIDFAAVWEHVVSLFQGDAYCLHGPAHWRRVERNGLLLAPRTGGNIEVVRLFAIFHDAMRVNDDVDEGHGRRGAELAAKLRGQLFDLDAKSFDLLSYAFAWHTDRTHSDDPTIGTCWDADRLDLGRVGIIPHEDYMSTRPGKEMARLGTTYFAARGEDGPQEDET
jgi:uncharacterized protein